MLWERRRFWCRRIVSYCCGGCAQNRKSLSEEDQDSAAVSNRMEWILGRAKHLNEDAKLCGGRVWRLRMGWNVRVRLLLLLPENPCGVCSIGVTVDNDKRELLWSCRGTLGGGYQEEEEKKEQNQRKTDQAGVIIINNNSCYLESQICKVIYS